MLARRVEPMPRGQSERLASLLGELLAEAGIGWGDLDALAVCTGPGNFTGLRIGVAFARGLALGRGLPVAGVTLFEALAEGHPAPLLVSTEDRRGELFVQILDENHREPFLCTMAGLPALPPETLCLGHRAGEIAAHLGCRAGSEATAPDPVAIARAARFGPGTPRPAPLYVRPADAAPPSEPPLLILDDA